MSENPSATDNDNDVPYELEEGVPLDVDKQQAKQVRRHQARKAIESLREQKRLQALLEEDEFEQYLAEEDE